MDMAMFVALGGSGRLTRLSWQDDRSTPSLIVIGYGE